MVLISPEKYRDKKVESNKYSILLPDGNLMCLCNPETYLLNQVIVFVCLLVYMLIKLIFQTDFR